MPSASVYLWISLPNMVVVVLSFLILTSWIGVPVNPKIIECLKVSFIVVNMSPKVDRWHSSMIMTSLLDLIFLRSASFNPSISSEILLSFWMDVTISVLSWSSLFSFDIRISVFSVACMLSVSVANDLYSLSDWIPSSFLSTRNITLSASWELAINWADLKLVIVFPLPVVCHTWPPRCVSGVSSFQFLFVTRSAIPIAA